MEKNINMGKKPKRPNYLASNVLEYVDFTKSTEDNLKILKKHGIDMTEHTFHVKLKNEGKLEAHYNIKQTIFRLLDITKTLEKNQKFLRGLGYTKYTSDGFLYNMMRQKKKGLKCYNPSDYE